jgi:hypothetical protein
MIHLLVLAEDACLRATCAEVLTRLGFRATVGAWPARGGDETPDAILILEASGADVSSIGAAYGDVPLFVCTWRHREHWPDSVRVVRLPFNGERVARMVELALGLWRKPPPQHP